MAKKKAAANTGVAKKDQFDYAAVPAMLEQVKSKIKELMGDTEDANQTTGELDGFGNIFNLTNPSDLIKAYSSVKGRENAYIAAAKEMKIKDVPPFKLGKAGAAKWYADITKCYKIATHKQELDKLRKIETELKGLLSEEDKRQASMATIADLLNSPAVEQD